MGIILLIDIVNAVFGLFWLLGSFLKGWLYDISLFGLIAFSMLAQLTAIPFIMHYLSFNKVVKQ